MVGATVFNEGRGEYVSNFATHPNHQECSDEFAKNSISLVVCVISSGCSFHAPLADVDYGEFPTKYEELVVKHFESVLIVPFSAHYKIGQLQKAYANAGLAFGGGVICTVRKWTF